MEKEDLTKLYAKKKWLQKSSSFLNQIILKDMDDDDDEDDDSEKSDEDKSEDESEEEGGSIPKWDKNLSSSFGIEISKKDRVIKYTGTNYSWNSTGLAKKSLKFAVKLGDLCCTSMVGFAPKDINKTSQNYTSKGYYYYCSTGGLYSQNGKSNASFTTPDYAINTVYGFKYDKKKRNNSNI